MLDTLGTVSGRNSEKGTLQLHETVQSFVHKHTEALKSGLNSVTSGDSAHISEYKCTHGKCAVCARGLLNGRLRPHESGFSQSGETLSVTLTFLQNFPIRLAPLCLFLHHLLLSLCLSSAGQSTGQSTGWLHKTCSGCAGSPRMYRHSFPASISAAAYTQSQVPPYIFACLRFWWIS